MSENMFKLNAGILLYGYAPFDYTNIKLRLTFWMLEPFGFPPSHA